MSSDLRRMLAPAWMALALQYGRFLIVGMAATAVHVSLYVGCVALLGMTPLLANTIGFALGVQVSYFGHGRWTFRDAEGSRLRFWAVSGVGFALNTLFVQLVTGTLGLGYGWAIPLIAGVTPVLTFTLSKLWAFRA